MDRTVRTRWSRRMLVTGAENTALMTPRVGVARLDVHSSDGVFTIGRDDFPDFAEFERRGIHVQSDRVRIAHPDPGYVEAALTFLAEACVELGVPEAEILFIETVVPPPAF